MTENEIKFGFLKQKNKKCEWKIEEEDVMIYYTACNKSFYFVNGNVKDSHFTFCPFCGKEIKT
jgi:hypothetical protein